MAFWLSHSSSVDGILNNDIDAGTERRKEAEWNIKCQRAGARLRYGLKTKHAVGLKL